MKYKYNGQWYDVTIKALDSMPVGTIVDYDGQVSDIPSGWEQASDDRVVLFSNTSGQTGNIEFNGNYTDYDYLMITDDLGTGLLYTGKNVLTISTHSYADMLYQEYDVLKLTYNSSTQKTTIQHQYQGNYYSGTNHSNNYKIYKVYGIKM